MKRNPTITAWKVCRSDACKFLPLNLFNNMAATATTLSFPRVLAVLGSEHLSLNKLLAKTHATFYTGKGGGVGRSFVLCPHVLKEGCSQ